jgi:hypothetical protein
LWPPSRYYPKNWLERLRKTRKNAEQPTSGPRYETETIQIQSMRANHFTAAFAIRVFFTKGTLQHNFIPYI